MNWNYVKRKSIGWSLFSLPIAFVFWNVSSAILFLTMILAFAMFMIFAGIWLLVD